MTSTGQSHIFTGHNDPAQNKVTRAALEQLLSSPSNLETYQATLRPHEKRALGIPTAHGTDSATRDLEEMEAALKSVVKVRL